jgi:hypothetical protein
MAKSLPPLVADGVLADGDAAGTDNRRALQALLDAAAAPAGSRLVALPPGDYRIAHDRGHTDGVYLRGGVTLRGAGAGVTRILVGRPPVPGCNALTVAGAEADVRIEDLDVIGPYPVHGDADDPALALVASDGAAATGVRVALRRVRLGGATFGVHWSNGLADGAGRDGDDLLVADCDLQSYMPVMHSGRGTLRLRDCDLRDHGVSTQGGAPDGKALNKYHGLYASPRIDLDVARCRFTGYAPGGLGYGVQVYDENPEDEAGPCRFVDCTFDATHYRALLGSLRGLTVVRGCRFAAADVQLLLPNDGEVRDCEFAGPGVALRGWADGPAAAGVVRVGGCRFAGPGRPLDAALSGQRWAFIDCDFPDRGQAEAMAPAGPSPAEFLACTFAPDPPPPTPTGA